MVIGMDDYAACLLKALEAAGVRSCWLARAMGVSNSKVTRWTKGTTPLSPENLEHALTLIPKIAAIRKRATHTFDDELRALREAE